MVALIATAVAVPTVGITASVSTVATITALTTLHDTWLILLLPIYMELCHVLDADHDVG